MDTIGRSQVMSERGSVRGLSNAFIDCLKSGFLSPITSLVIDDPDLDLEIRRSYINVYYKGNSLLKLTEAAPGRYTAQIHPKFTGDLQLPAVYSDEAAVSHFVSAVPMMKRNIARRGKQSREVEYEQLIIRANNLEPRNNTEYFIVDRQYAAREGRFDLTGMFWDGRHRKRNQEVPVCLMEIKFALNPDIDRVHEQLARYYESICPHAAQLAEELEGIFRQKLALGLYRQPAARLDAMKTLRFTRSIDQFQFVLVLVDYNPHSSKFRPELLSDLAFARQLHVFHRRFAMWRQNVMPVPLTAATPRQ